MSELKEPELKIYRGKWYITWYEGGQRKRLSTGTTDKKTAFQSLIDFKENYSNKPDFLTVTQALKRYIKFREGKVMALSRIQEASIRIIEIMGDLKIEQVTQTQWDYYASKRIKKNSQTNNTQLVSSGTLRREFNVLRAALNLAWKNGFLDRPPTITPPRDSAPRNRYLTKDEARRLLDICETPHVKTFLALAFYTGARKGAILALTWDRVDFNNGIVDFQEPGRPLTVKRRSIVPLHDSLKEILISAYQYSTCDFVVEYNSRKVNTGIRWPFLKLCKKAGLD